MTDTIAALGTPVGTGALAVLRVSGPDASRIAAEIFGEVGPPRAACRGDYRDRQGTLVDDVLHIFFKGPHSYTGEDVLEIFTHGNPYIAQRILEDLYARGCGAAGPGEFTRRAFLNGRMDLSQAEAVMDLISARSERALASAQRQLRGALSAQMNELSGKLVAALAQVEAYIDFPDEDLPPENRTALRESLQGIAAGTARLLATQHYGEVLREGIRTVIVGEPNAGKSSLLNRLVGRDRAIVSAEPGTTRDFIEERMLAGPHLFRLVDTAGLNPAPGAVERMGMEKTREQVAGADIVILLLDGTRPLPPFAAELLAQGPVVAVNKIDLAAAHSPLGFPTPSHGISAITGEGVAALVAALVARADAMQPAAGEDAIAINARHAHALKEARECLAGALEKLAGPHDPALLASDLRGALDAFGQIGGKIDHERVLDELFASFCIGK